MKKLVPVLVFLMFVFAAAHSAADTYDFEIGLSTDHSRSDFFAVALDAQGMPLMPRVTTDGYFDSDEVSLTGIWYFDGLSDATGPRARAAFMSRASSVSLSYARGDRESDATVNPPSPIVFPARTDTTSDALLASLRYVSRESGWFATASIGYLSAETSFGAGSGDDTDATLYAAGIGKYIAQSTAVEASIGRTDGDFNDQTSYALAVTHIGALGEQWQYGVDVAYSKIDNSFDDGRILLRPSLYPNPDVEFGIELSHQQFDGGFDATGITGFASWFVRSHLAISARYGTVDEDESPGVDTDNTLFGIGIDVRF